MLFRSPPPLPCQLWKPERALTARHPASPDPQSPHDPTLDPPPGALREGPRHAKRSNPPRDGKGRARRRQGPRKGQPGRHRGRRRRTHDRRAQCRRVSAPPALPRGDRWLVQRAILLCTYLPETSFRNQSAVRSTRARRGLHNRHSFASLLHDSEDWRLLAGPPLELAGVVVVAQTRLSHAVQALPRRKTRPVRLLRVIEPVNTPSQSWVSSGPPGWGLWALTGAGARARGG